MASSSNIKIFSGTTSLYLSEQIAKAYGTTLGNVCTCFVFISLLFR